MTFSDTLDSMDETNNASKRSGSMTGYVWRFTSAKNGLPALTTDGDCYLAFVQIDGDQFIYKYTASTKSFEYKGKVAGAAGTRALDDSTSPTAGNKLELDAVLLKHIWTGDDWTTGKQSEFDAVRVPQSGAEW